MSLCHYSVSMVINRVRLLILANCSIGELTRVVVLVAAVVVVVVHLMYSSMDYKPNVEVKARVVNTVAVKKEMQQEVHTSRSQ